MKVIGNALACATGAFHAQPAGEQVALEACLFLGPGFSVDVRGALDAPDVIPRGGVRGLDFPEGEHPMRLLVAHHWRDGHRC